MEKRIYVAPEIHVHAIRVKQLLMTSNTERMNEANNEELWEWE